MTSKRADMFSRLPWPLWVIGSVTCALLLFEIHSRYMELAQINFDTTTAILFSYVIISTYHMFVRHRNAWIVMIFGWAIAFGIIVFRGFTKTEPLTLINIAELPLLLACVALGKFYFKYPYINVRSNLIGPAHRFQLSLAGQLSAGGREHPCEVTTLSVTGFAISRPANLPPLHANDELWISIDDINGFRSKVSLVMETPTSITLKIQGFTPSSVVEHIKIRRYVSRLQKNGQPVRSQAAS